MGLFGKLAGAYMAPYRWATDKPAKVVTNAASDVADATSEFVRGPVTEAAGSAWDVLSGDRDRKFSADEAQKARDYQIWFEQNKHKLNAEGLESAGINPMLAGQIGSGSAASNVVAHASDNSGAARDLLGKGISLLTQLAQVRQMNSQSKLNEASAVKSLTEAGDIGKTQQGRVDQLVAGLQEIRSRVLLHGKQADTEGARKANVEADTASKMAVTREIDQRIQKLRHETSSAKSQAERDAKAAEFAQSLGGDIQRWSDAIGLKGHDLTQMLTFSGALSKSLGGLINVFKK